MAGIGSIPPTPPKKKLSMFTHDPDAVKLHGVVVEVLDLRNPPISRAVLEEVWEGGEGPVDLEIPCRESLGCLRNNDTPVIRR